MFEQYVEEVTFAVELATAETVGAILVEVAVPVRKADVELAEIFGVAETITVLSTVVVPFADLLGIGEETTETIEGPTRVVLFAGLLGIEETTETIEGPTRVVLLADVIGLGEATAVWSETDDPREPVE